MEIPSQAHLGSLLQCRTSGRTCDQCLAGYRIWTEGYEQLTHETITGVTVDYPQPETIGADRLANAMAAAHLYGAPSVVVDFGTALTFDVVNDQKAYVGGIIAPGISLMTDYFHEKTALLPKITVADPKAIIGKSTEQAMQIGSRARLSRFGGLSDRCSQAGNEHPSTSCHCHRGLRRLDHARDEGHHGAMPTTDSGRTEAIASLRHA